MKPPHVVLENVSKKYGDKVVLDNLNLELGEAEMVALLGPSGCGKSTSLRILAGLESADSGKILIAGNDVSRKPTRDRRMGIVFQAYSLFPHMTAVENVGYGLKIRGLKHAARNKRAESLLELVGLNEHMHKHPNQMSGGQQQRVALARALAIEPDVLLLDEPLSALDAKVRNQLRDEIRRIQLTEGIATLLVTHDQEEAITMADRVGVMQAGSIEQIDTPKELYANPQTPFISQFVGICNRIPGIIRGGGIRVFGQNLTIVNSGDAVAAHSSATALIRPEEIQCTADPHGNFRVVGTVLRGIFTSVMVDDGVGNSALRIDMSSRSADRLHYGDAVSLKVLRGDTVIDDADAEEKKIAEHYRSSFSGTRKESV